MEYLDKQYLGDGVYVSHDGYQFRLTTENGDNGPPIDEIFLEPSVFSALAQYVAKITARPAPAGTTESGARE